MPPDLPVALGRVLLTAALCVLLGLQSPAWSRHPGSIDAVLTLEGNGVFQLDLEIDLDALAMGGSDHQHHGGPTRGQRLAGLSDAERVEMERGLKNLVRRRIKLLANGAPVATRISFPKRSLEGQGGKAEGYFGTAVRLSGLLGPEVEEVSVGVSRAFGAVRLVVRTPGGAEISRQSLEPGERSRPVLLSSLPVSKLKGEG